MKKTPEFLQYRNKEDENLEFRALSISAPADGPPDSFDEKTRSVEFVCSTEAPARVLDRERWEVVWEVLLMSGCELPESRQIVLVDTHKAFEGVANILGSCRGLEITALQLLGRAYFSSVAEAESAMTKVKERHITDVSVGYQVYESIWIDEGDQREIQGKMYSGPLKVATRWKPFELSLLAIGADEQAKTRSKVNTKNKREENVMDAELRKFLESRGLAKDATEVEAWALLATLQIPEKRSLDVDPGKILEKVPEKISEKTPEQFQLDGARSEQERMIEIRGAATQFDYPEEDTLKLITDNIPASEARKKINDAFIVRKEAETKAPAPHEFEMGALENDKFRSAVEEALTVRGGMVVKEPMFENCGLENYNFREMAREFLRKAGKPVNGNVSELMGRALTTSDLPYALSNVQNKFLLDGWETAEETWGAWVGEGSANDFKTQTGVRTSETVDLDEIKEHGEYHYGSLDEAREQFALATYGKILPISRQALINDDLGVLTDIPRKHGEAVSRKIGDVVYSVLISNAAMGDGVALFHLATHGNISTASVVDVDVCAEVIKQMKLQKDLKGLRSLNIRPVFYIAPVTVEGASEQFFRTQFIGGSSNQPNLDNPYYNTYFTRIYEPRLDADDVAAYYFAAKKGSSVKVFYLQGVKTPYMELRQGFTVDGVEHKVRMDVAAKAMDWKTLNYNAGP